MAEELKACPCCHQPASPYGCKSAGCMNPDCMLTGMWFEWDTWQRKRAQLHSQGGEAVEVVAVAFITRAEKSGPKIAITLKKEDAEKQHKNWLSMSKIITTEPLMTVAQHQRILAASVGSGEPVATYMGTDWAAQSQFMAQCASLEPGTDLYTHPADQVADDLTMVKVSRELLERAVYNMELAEMDGPTCRELRALLAKP